MSLSWGAKRQFIYMGVVFVAIIAGALIVLWPTFHREPTCFDGKMNGNESGIDCGGACAKVCTADALQLVTLWARAFEVTPGKYNLMAYVENQNRESAIPAISYEFKVYDDKNIFIGRRQGTAFITSNARSAVFEPSFDAGNRIPARVTFEFTSAPLWIKVSREQKNSLNISAEDQVLSNPLSSPKLEAVINNKTLNEIKNLDVYAILYDENDNVMTASKTLIEVMPKNAKAPIVFTWPRALSKRPTRIDIFPEVNIFDIAR